MTLDRFLLNRVNSCNKSFWAQNLYYQKSTRTFFINTNDFYFVQFVGPDPPAYRQAGDHASQIVHSGDAPYGTCKMIYWVCISKNREQIKKVRGEYN
jgi:hypothetical protein